MGFYLRCLAAVSIFALWCLCGGQAPAPPRRCRFNSDCDDGLDCTLDYCDPLNSLCFNVPKVISQQPAACRTFAARVTRENILARANAVPLTEAERVSILQHVITVQSDLHPHRNFHLTSLRVDIIPKLTALLSRVQDAAIPPLTNEKFHTEIISILTEIDDLHSFYVSPGALRSSLAFLPFKIAEFYSRKSRKSRFAVSEVIADALTPAQRRFFTAGTEIISWNGVPIRRAVFAAGKAGFGANPAAKFARGAQDLTNRFLGFQPFPDAGPFVIKFKTRWGRVKSIQLDWIYTSIPLELANLLFGIPPSAPSPATTSRQILPLPQLTRIASTTNNNGRVRGVKRTSIPVSSPIDFNLFAEVVDVRKLGTYGVITMVDFNPPNNELWLAEVKRLLFTQLPQTGVVIDIRNNLGGNGEVCQRVAPLFTGSTVKSVGGVFRITQLTGPLALGLPRGRFVSVEAHERYLQSVQQAINLGSEFTPFQDDNLTALINSDTTPPYPGPVIVLTSAKSYSCAEVLVANFLDTVPRIGKVIGVHDATGGGGGLQFDSVFLSQFGVPPPGATVFTRNNVRRLERTGVNQGRTFEWFGIKPEKRYFPTKFDAESGDIDLLKFLAKELRRMKKKA